MITVLSLSFSMLAMGFTGSKALQFKIAYINAFDRMEAELQRRRAERIEEKPVRRTLTDAIKNRPQVNIWDYKLYTDLALKTASGMNATQLKRSRAVSPKSTGVDLLTADELKRYRPAEAAIAALLEAGYDYGNIKILIAEVTA